MRVGILLPFVALLTACSGVYNTGPTEPAETVALPGPPGAAPLPPPSSEPKDLPGVDTSSFSRREKERFFRLVNQLYAPCSDQAVSLAVCVEERRPCAACTPAVKLIAQRVRGGAMAEEVQNAYGMRFGPNVKTVTATDSPAKGPADAPVTIVEWFDFECPHCRAAAPLLEKIVEKYPGKVRLVHRMYPLKNHTRAEPAARAAIAAHFQGRYWEMEKAIFEHPTALTDQDLEKYATGLKLDLARFRTDMKSSKTSDLLARDHADAEKLGLGGTPFILINGRDFDLGMFHLDTDLDEWVGLEIGLKSGGAPKK